MHEMTRSLFITRLLFFYLSTIGLFVYFFAFITRLSFSLKRRRLQHNFQILQLINVDETLASTRVASQAAPKQLSIG